MASKIYEINVFKDQRPVRDMPAFLSAVDLEDGENTERTLNQHLLGAVRRANAHRSDIHRFHLEFRDIDAGGKARGPVLFRWVMPASEDA
ncbi:hypothetical protein ACGFIW_01565 [Micromonospora sp. NPDC048935]|uniref:hypothetical protein n=1 Tax=Micromonospora sp. NPDC048935 TaxID=3364262 RepID=UPI0037100B8D